MFVRQHVALTSDPVILLLTCGNNHMMQEKKEIRSIACRNRLGMSCVDILAEVSCGMSKQVVQCQSYAAFSVVQTSFKNMIWILFHITYILSYL